MKSFFKPASLLGAALLLASLISPTLAAPFNETWSIQGRAAPGERLVFAHFMMGIVAPRNSRADWDADMMRAKQAGIDAFALNIAQDDYTRRQLDLAYESAAANGMKVFISFDFNYFQPVREAAGKVAALVNDYGVKAAQLKIGDKAVVSSFLGDGTNANGPLNIGALKAEVRIPMFFAPNFAPWNTQNPGQLDAAFNWQGWVHDGYGKSPRPGQVKTIETGDSEYRSWLGGKPYMAPVSPWFFTHYMKYENKNWVMGTGMSWFERWSEILRSSPEYLEIVSWNDYGESHYIGPLSSKHADDGHSKYVNDMPHDGWLEMAKPFIAAYKARQSSPNAYINKDQIIYWYRPTPKSVNCQNDPLGGRPDGWDMMEDSVFVVSLLTQPGSITVTSGGNSAVTWNAPAGAYSQKVPMGVGAQMFDLSRNGKSVISGTSPKDIVNFCPCGVNNFNAFVGQIPFEPFGTLDSTGLGEFSAGLTTGNCKPQPTLGGRTPGSGGSNSDNPSTPTPTPTPDPAPSPIPNPTNCNGGTNRKDVSGNLSGLCEFACKRNYCPSDACVCTSTGTPLLPVWNSPDGCPLPGLGSEYNGLCSYACSNGYCPPAACTRNSCPAK
ncbi:putative alpha-1,3-glucanase/mutanase [Rhypophila decipiens]|uniref:Alpha-1,3-glucanase/mutanase n=1 Tax=Rhypophila decipiens TaxID=261697 RepID=A0AAN6Y3E0_9PEZI|nr:putative alpha-1,3-glucanase/mutanase [Rhypophila decipiens]